MKKVIAIGGCHLFDDALDNFYQKLKKEYPDYNFKRIPAHIATGYKNNPDFERALQIIENPSSDFDHNSILILQLGNVLFANKISAFVPLRITNYFLNSKNFANSVYNDQIEKKSISIEAPPPKTNYLYKYAYSSLKVVLVLPNIILASIVFIYKAKRIKAALGYFSKQNGQIIITTPFCCILPSTKILRAVGTFLFKALFKSIKNCTIIDCFTATAEPSSFKNLVHLNQKGHDVIFNIINKKLKKAPTFPLVKHALIFTQA